MTTSKLHRLCRTLDLRRARVTAALAALMVMSGQVWAADPQFRDYPAGPLYQGPSAPPMLVTSEEKLFWTRLRDGAREPANFAGHYTLVRWGCGTSCAQGAVIDKLTGRVTLIPSESVCCTAHFPEDGETIIGRPDSRLLVLIGELGEEPPDAKHFYSFDGSAFTLIRTVPFEPNPADQSSQDCKAINSAVERLDCYDKAYNR